MSLTELETLTLESMEEAAVEWAILSANRCRDNDDEERARAWERQRERFEALAKKLRDVQVV